MTACAVAITPLRGIGNQERESPGHHIGGEIGAQYAAHHAEQNENRRGRHHGACEGDQEQHTDDDPARCRGYRPRKGRGSLFVDRSPRQAEAHAQCHQGRHDESRGKRRQQRLLGRRLGIRWHAGGQGEWDRSRPSSRMKAASSREGDAADLEQVDEEGRLARRPAESRQAVRPVRTSSITRCQATMNITIGTMSIAFSASTGINDSRGICEPMSRITRDRIQGTVTRWKKRRMLAKKKPKLRRAHRRTTISQEARSSSAPLSRQRFVQRCPVRRPGVARRCPA